MIDDRPAIYVSNWGSHRTPGAHGPGRKWSIMAAPRRWEIGDGVLYPCTPAIEDLRSVQAGTMSLEEYRLRCETRWDIWPDAFAPWKLRCFRPRPFGGNSIRDPSIVRDGDSLLCGCAKGKPCHRVWLAPRLNAAGWRVILDGTEFVPAPLEAP